MNCTVRSLVSKLQLIYSLLWNHYTAAPGTFGLTFRHFANTAMGKVTPANAIANANDSFSPSMYASTTPGSSSAEKTARNWVAPVATTKAGLTPGARIGTRASNRLVYAAWPAETKKAPPIVWKTERAVNKTVLRLRRTKDSVLTKRDRSDGRYFRDFDEGLVGNNGYLD